MCTNSLKQQKHPFACAIGDIIKHLVGGLIDSKVLVFGHLPYAIFDV